jgi:hypothetical protein
MLLTFMPRLFVPKELKEKYICAKLFLLPLFHKSVSSWKTFVHVPGNHLYPGPPPPRRALAWALRGYAGLCRAMRGYAGLCGAMRGFAGLCGAMRGRYAGLIEIYETPYIV